MTSVLSRLSGGRPRGRSSGFSGRGIACPRSVKRLRQLVEPGASGSHMQRSNQSLSPASTCRGPVLGLLCWKRFTGTGG